MTKNCWEFMKCGQDKNCVVFDKQAGQLCYLIAGTLCGGKVQGTFAKKNGDCRKCEYFHYLQEKVKPMRIVNI